MAPIQLLPGLANQAQLLAIRFSLGTLIPTIASLVAIVALLGAFLYTRSLRRSFARLRTELESELTGRRRAVAALQVSEAVYHSLVENLPQSILRKDLEGRFTFANGRFCGELGQPLDDVVGRTDFDFFPAELAEKYREDDRKVIQTREPIDVVEQHVTPSGETLYVQVMKVPLLGPDGVPIGMQGIFWDVTARVRAEEQLQDKNRKLQEMAESEREANLALKAAQSRMVETEKLASLGQLVAGVAHEINNPLAFVINNVAVLERDLLDVHNLLELYSHAEPELAKIAPNRQREIDLLREQRDLVYTVQNLPGLISRTREGLRRIERIVVDLRLFARMDEGDLNEIDLNAGVDSCVNIIEGLAKKHGVRIQKDLQPVPQMRCFAAKINQVIINLLSNAIDACEEGGMVLVKTRPEPSGVRIEVQDNGCGMSREVRERIFVPFFTTKPVGHGTGLGLSISYGIVTEHGGSIEVESEPGEGTRFVVRLPLAPKLRKAT